MRCGNFGIANADACRVLLDELRANGVEYVKRDGRLYRLLRLPSLASDASPEPAKVVPRRARVEAIA